MMKLTNKAGGDYEIGDELDLTRAYLVEGREGLAYHVKGFAQSWVPYVTVDPDTGEEWPSEDGEWEDDADRVMVVAVGDDHPVTVSIDELGDLAEGSYCTICGQTGCTQDAL